MPRHEQRDISFDVPRHWDDKTIVAYGAPAAPSRAGDTPAPPGQSVAANVVMTRDTLREGETLGRYADRQLASMAKRLDGFELVRRDEQTLGGAPAVAVRFTSRGQSGPLEQRLVVIEGRRRSVYCFTTTTAKGDAEQNNPLFDRILGTIRFPEVAG